MTSRVQLALNVADIDQATDHYRTMFGVEPHKTRVGYANFEIDDPPLKLVLFEQADNASPLNHLGVELIDEEAVAAMADRFRSAGLPHRLSGSEVCCHAEQTKVYVDTPDVPIGAWEFYAITDDDPEVTAAGNQGTCCANEAATPGSADGCCR